MNDQILGDLDLFIDANWDVYLWTCFDVPKYVSSKNLRVLGPKRSFSRIPQSRLLQLRVMRSKRPIFRIPRELFVEKAIDKKNKVGKYLRVRFRRELAWWHLKFDAEVNMQQYHAVVAADSFVIFATWKLVQRTKPPHARASLTNVASLIGEQ